MGVCGSAPDTGLKNVVSLYPVTMADGTNSEVGIRDLKAKLSEYVHRVWMRGEVVWVTKNGKRIAALVPVEVAEAVEAAEVLASLRAKAT
jgi:prevent-host-death family protein